MARITIAALQQQVKELQETNRLLVKDVTILTEQNSFFRTQSTSGQLSSLNCTLQRIAETCTTMLQSIPAYTAARRDR
jgi:hypothetical protein